jgi:hypothetical protein
MLRLGWAETKIHISRAAGEHAQRGCGQIAPADLGNQILQERRAFVNGSQPRLSLLDDDDHPSGKPRDAQRPPECGNL